MIVGVKVSLQIYNVAGLKQFSSVQKSHALYHLQNLEEFNSPHLYHKTPV